MGCFVIAEFGSGSHVKRCDMCRSDAFEAAIVVSRGQKLKGIDELCEDEKLRHSCAGDLIVVVIVVVIVIVIVIADSFWH